MKYEVIGLTDVGLVRKNNEDSFLIEKDLNLFVVADGMGGYQKGEVASLLTCESMASYLKDLQENKKINLLEDQLKDSVLTANKTIREKILSSQDLEKMGTTVVGILLKDDKLMVVNVGDSRAYRLRNNKIEQISIDHSLVQESKAAGLKRELPSQFRNIVTRALGMKESVVPDVYTLPVLQNDKFLLCSDGLHGLVPDNKIKDIINNGHSLNDQAKALISLAKKAGGKDNITCILLHVFESSLNVTPSNIDTQTVEIPTSKKHVSDLKSLSKRQKFFLIISLVIILSLILLLYFSGNIL